MTLTLHKDQELIFQCADLPAIFRPAHLFDRRETLQMIILSVRYRMASIPTSTR